MGKEKNIVNTERKKKCIVIKQICLLLFWYVHTNIKTRIGHFLWVNKLCNYITNGQKKDLKKDKENESNYTLDYVDGGVLCVYTTSSVTAGTGAQLPQKAPPPTKEINK